MHRLDRGEINLAIVAPPTSPIGETGGAQVFTGTLANALADQGFPVRVYGQDGPSFTFNEGVTYIETGPTGNEVVANDRVSLKRAVNETAVATPLQLAMDVAQSPDQQWVVIDNNITSAPLAPFLRGTPHMFIQHSCMTPNAYRIYERVKASGGKIIAIADQQREKVTANFGPLHDVTIKNGIDPRNFAGAHPRLRQRGEPIHVGTLSRIERTDIKGVTLAARAVKMLRQQHDAYLTIAGPVDEATYDSVVAPLLEDYVTYVGAKRGKEKIDYLAGVHVGAALSNPGGWDDATGTFSSCFVEGNSLALPEMIYAGVIPVSTDSGGAEPMIDAGLGDFVVPLADIRNLGMDAFTDRTANRMLKAAHYDIGPSALRRRVRTIDDVGHDYATYIMDLLRVKPVIAP